jgi:beta-glucosidase
MRGIRWEAGNHMSDNLNETTIPSATLHFPAGFLWGCATAAHQVEGGNVNDWWRWEQQPGRIFQNQRAGQACQWWDGRYAEDFDRAKAMHNNALRFSVEWSRLEPEQGQWDERALDHYRQMLLALQARGLRPMITLFHFTLPLWLADKGGWLNPETPTWFARFAGWVAAGLGNLCDLWCTLNEPMVYATSGYLFGAWPPGQKNLRAASTAAVNLIRGHVAAYHAIKKASPSAQVGFAKHQITSLPYKPAWIHAPASRTIIYYFNEAFILAFRDGHSKFTGVGRVQLPEAKGTLDWIGLQYYQEFRSGFDLRSPATLFATQRQPKDMPTGPHTWGGLNPGGILAHIRWLTTALDNTPIYITECGVPDPTDSIRPGYLAESVVAVWKAVGFNFPVRGFFFWSLLDNFEWVEGYDPRYSFGLYQTDFASQARVARPSAAFYGEICQANAISAAMVVQHAPTVLAKLFPGGPGQDAVSLKRP